MPASATSSATSAPAPARRFITWLSGHVPFLLVTLFGLYLLWPVPAGVMPLSADHTVHLTRAFLLSEQLAGGHLAGWDPTWFFGFPLGELYPVLGDLGVIALRVLSLGLLDWPRAYAGLFTLVFLTQGWALLRCGRALGWGPIPGLVAGLLVLADVGAYREGGWIYTVTYGVWPQALATALAYLAFAELALAQARPGAGDASVPSDTSPAPSDSPFAASAPVLTDTSPAPSASPSRHLARAALAAAGALLAHPMALMMLALAAPLYLLTVGLRPAHPRERRGHLADTTLHLLLALGIGGALAAWWLLPMSAHRGWMASYGWLHASLSEMLRMAGQGQWTQLMPAAVGHSASLGLLLAALFGRAPLRFFALWTAAHWLLASTDLFWGLRLDWLSGGFQHIQYQRFLTAAKPGLFLLAGAAVGGLVHLSLRTWRMRHVRKHIRVLSAVALTAALALAAWQLRDSRALMQRHQVGAVQTERIPGQPGFAADYAALLAWARAAWDARDGDYRMAFRADRNAHWFMDAPVTTRTPSYKLGFTPGDNFVHKPESGDPALLRRLGVRFLVGTGGAGPAGSTLAARFGKLSVFELAEREGLAHLDHAAPGAGTVTVEHADLAGAGRMRLRVAGVTDDATRLVLHVAGYPRWQLIHQPADGGPERAIEWFEVPVLGDLPIATQAQRRSGELRGGKALGDSGREPTLIAAPARDGTYELRYRRWTGVDILGLGLTSLGLVGLALLLRGPRAPGSGLLARLRPWARRLAHPAVIAGLFALGLALALLRHRGGAAREHDLASARLLRGEAIASHAIAGPLKTDMLIFPAVLARPGRSNMSEVTFFKDLRLGPTLDGWFALDDDDAKQRRRGGHRLDFSARPVGADAWTPLADIAVPHRPDRRRLDDVAVPPALQNIPVELRVQVHTSGEAPPRLGFDLTLPAHNP
jgi:hypothetical protein